MDPEKARAALEEKRAAAVERLRGLDASFADIVEAARDSNLDDEHDIEGTTIAIDRAQVSSLAAAGRQQLVEIDAALTRLEAGEYGICLRCGQPIEEGRLEARPATPVCIACARAETSRR